MKVPNRPTPEGIELGTHLARMTEVAIADLVATGQPDTRCGSCAFRAGTEPNGCPPTLMDAIKCVAEGRLFLCHEDPALQTPCYGWRASRTTLEGQRLAMAWDFSYDSAQEQLPHGS